MTSDEHITRAARVLLEELPPTDLTIETMGEAAAHEEWRKIAARMLDAAGAMGDVIPPSPDALDDPNLINRAGLLFRERVGPARAEATDPVEFVAMVHSVVDAARGVVLPVPPEP